MSEQRFQRSGNGTQPMEHCSRASGTKEDVKSLNIYLDTLQTRVYEAQRQLVADNKPVTVNALKQRLDGAPKVKARMLIEVFDGHSNQTAQLVGKDCAEGTLEHYTVARNHTVAFLQWRWKVSDGIVEPKPYW